MNLEQWTTAVQGFYPKVQITVEDGSGVTYGEIGAATAHTGPDMQVDVVGFWSPATGTWDIWGAVTE